MRQTFAPEVISNVADNTVLRAVGGSAPEMNESKVMSINVSPNPSRDRIQILVNAPEADDNATVTIHSISGVLIKTIPLSSSKQTIAIDVSSWKSGVYLMNLHSNGTVVNKRFVKL